MWIGTVFTDANGIVLFDPGRLRERYGGSIAERTDLFTKFIATDEGDEVLKEGIVVPILSIDDAGYEVVVRRASEAYTPPGVALVENGVYPLRVSDRLVIADIAVLRDWADGLGWEDVSVPAGIYAVTIRGFQELDVSGRTILHAGYEIILAAQECLPAFTADTGRNMRVLDFQPP